MVIWKNQLSEFAIGLRSLVFWGHFQKNHAMEVHTDSEEAVGALLRQADVGRPVKVDFTGSVDKSCRRCHSKKKM